MRTNAQPRVRYVDSDSHVLEPADLWDNYLDAEFRDDAPITFAGYRGDDPVGFGVDVSVAGIEMPDYSTGRDLPFPGIDKYYGDAIQDGFSPQSYLRAIDAAGIDYMILYPTVGLYVCAAPSLSPATAAAYRRAYNRWLGDFCAQGNGRLIGAAAVDLRDPVEAAREARFCVEKFGFRAVVIVPDPVTEHPLFDHFYDPLWEAVQELDVPLALHAGAGTPINLCSDRFGRWVQGRSTSAFVMSNMAASMALVAGGVLERFPRMRVVHLEVGCGWLPYWLDRMQAGIQGSNRSEDRFVKLQGLTLSPLEYFQRQCFVACDPDDPHISYFIDQVGDQSLVTATDFAHPEGRGYLQAIDETLRLDGPSDETKRRIMWDNPLRLYGIEPVEAR